MPSMTFLIYPDVQTIQEIVSLSLGSVRTSRTVKERKTDLGSLLDFDPSTGVTLDSQMMIVLVFLFSFKDGQLLQRRFFIVLFEHERKKNKPLEFRVWRSHEVTYPLRLRFLGPSHVDDHRMLTLFPMGPSVMSIFGRTTSIEARQADVHSFGLILGRTESQSEGGKRSAWKGEDT